jgi:hypothetical protein
MRTTVKALAMILIAIQCAMMGVSHAQSSWHKVAMMNDGVPYEHLLAISVPASAEYNGRSLKAYVFIDEHDGSGLSGVPHLGVYVEGVEDIIPENELLQFIGPELPKAVMVDGTFELSVDLGGSRGNLKTYADYNRAVFFHPGFKSEGYFALDYSKASKEKWRDLVAKMSSGFIGADITIGGRVLSHKLHIHFTGEGLGTQLKDMMSYCAK